MTESHLARTLFSQPSGTAPVRKKVVRSHEQVQSTPATNPMAPAESQLQKEVAEWQAKCAQLEAKVQEYQQNCAQAEALVQSLQQSLQEQITENQQLRARIAELEARIAQYLHSTESQPVAQEAEWKRQISELQEQILHQAAQISEYQTAIQYWKDQSLKHQHHAIQLSGAMERLLAEERVPKPTPPVHAKTTKTNRVELPSFLTKLR